MATPTSEQLRQAAEEVQLKRVREAAVIPQIKALFNRVAERSETYYAATGRIFSVEEFTPEWRALLAKHYLLTGKAFRGEAFDIVGDRAFNAVVAEAFAESMGKLSTDRARFITETNAQDVREAFTKARDAVAEAEKLPVIGKRLDVAVSRVGRRLVNQSFATRTPLIAETETQVAAENMKNIEARVMGGEPVVPGQRRVVDDPQHIVKTWVTVGDKRVRHSHALANGQTVPEDEPFIVNGERLRYPGDPSLGASLDNLARCRCTALYEVR